MAADSICQPCVCSDTYGFSIGLRNSHDKSMRLAMTCGYRVFVCSNMAFAGDFTPVLAKHSKSFSLVDCLSVGVDRMQRNFEPMRKQVEAWQRGELTDCHCEGRHLRGVCGGQAGSSKTPCAGPCMTCISNRSTRISGRERSGAFQMRLPLHSRH